MAVIFKKPKGLTDVETHYCPGCTHGVVHRLVAEVIEELNELENAICISPVGCSVLANNYFKMHGIQASHGRAPAVATGIKRTLPNKLVFTYQGDGDLASIGCSEIIHAAGRGENITVIYINNAIYGMTGGQMSPNTLVGQKTTTTPFGRDEKLSGAPLRMAELLSTIPSAYYVSRVSVHSPAEIRKAKKAIKQAFLNQQENKGFSIVEVLSTCNIGWGVTATDALDFVKDKMIPYYPLKTFKDGGQN